MTRVILGLALVAAGAARAQTMLDQEQRLIDLHSLLLDLPPAEAPGALAPGQLSVGLEVIAVPPIDGTTGNKRQITASDRTPAFPRPRIALGLPAPAGFRAFAGVSYVPPIIVRQVSVHYLGGEAGLAWTPEGPLRVGVRGHLLYADSQSPVTDPNLRDTLHTTELGAELSGGYQLAAGPVAVTPYGAVGVTHLSGTFLVTSDAVTLSSQATVLALQAGARLGWGPRWEGVAEVSYFPGRLLRPSFRVGYLFDLGFTRN